jgi:serine/threonine protein kinase
VSDRGADRDPLLGKVIDDYRLESRIGAGATGIVYRASHPGRTHKLAIKVLHENLGRISSLKRRFEREARALSRLAHPCIVHIADFGVSPEATYLAMELLEGETLETRMQRGPIEPDEILPIIKPVLAGLAFAHEMQIVHRDLKPANVFLAPDAVGSSVKILDFGLAKFLSIDELSSEATLTRKGRIVGTPAYMSPEQITGVSLDVRADVYAAGVVLFELIADLRPFDYERRSELLRAHLFEKPPEMHAVRPGLSVDPVLEGIVRKALSKDPAERFAHAGAMLRALDEVRGTPTSVSRVGLSRRERRREDSTSVVLSEHDMRELASSISEAGEGGTATERDATSMSARALAKDAAHRHDLTPLGGLPFDALVHPNEAPEPESIAKKLGPWLVAALVAFLAGALSYWVATHFGA